MMDAIRIEELEVFCHLGVTEAERHESQRLLVSLEIRHDFEEASRLDDIGKTIDYAAVYEYVVHMTKERQWKLLETLAEDMAREIKSQFGVAFLSVEIKKFVLPQTRYVSVQIQR